jgi:hypothetical protein
MGVAAGDIMWDYNQLLDYLVRWRTTAWNFMTMKTCVNQDMEAGLFSLQVVLVDDSKLYRSTESESTCAFSVSET